MSAPKPTLADLDYLPIPEAVRPELRRLLSRQRGWLAYRFKNKINLMHVTRAQWIAAALAFDIDIEKMVHDHCERTGRRLVRRQHLDGTAEQRKKIDFWS